MMSPPCCQSSKPYRRRRLNLRLFENDIVKSGFASPILRTTADPFGRLSLPTICVADAPSSIWNAPRAVPNPPVLNEGTGSATILLRVDAYDVRKIQSFSAD